MASKFKKNEYTGMILPVTYLVLFLVNSLVIFIANSFFPNAVVLGTSTLPFYWAISMSMGKLALLDTFAIPFVRVYENKRGKMFSSSEWMILYFLLNTAGVWLIARYAEKFGLGISSWRVALTLGLVLDFVQGFAMMRLEKYRDHLR